ncbi:pyridoxamine 5'-phosphate oxidase family protein [Fructilactobacillus cliffordii]|uniref:pyridoxamine 5'-phosphate oxidase family protein n=1 Tax=Fructilactobacillus cliffordii TaxID=2940299 RepID=UPI0020929E47|nr:pyridoxamine 5'-phosphate oxidase family protein [Fructilactobacillus cliffordii]USS86647.1 pyridoxamine 5'-phosphate oxidase family protein [Fructilactobacillus cliffordii]
MYLKRFVELFIVYVISFALGSLIYGWNFFTNYWFLILIGGIIGYIILIIPLTIMTIRKMTKRETASGENQPAQSRFSNVLAELPGNLYLATSDSDGNVSNSIVTYTQSEKQENVLYVVTDPKTKRAQNAVNHPQVAIASLYDPKLGTRFSSNQATVRVIQGKQAITELVNSTTALQGFDDNITNQAVLEITLTSAVIESFRDAPEVVKF